MGGLDGTWAMNCFWTDRPEPAVGSVVTVGTGIG